MDALINAVPVSAPLSYVTHSRIKLCFKTKRKAIYSLVMQIRPVYYLRIHPGIDPYYYVNPFSSTGLPIGPRWST